MRRLENMGVKGRGRCQSLYVAGRWNYKSDLGVKPGS